MAVPEPVFSGAEGVLGGGVFAGDWVLDEGVFGAGTAGNSVWVFDAAAGVVLPGPGVVLPGPGIEPGDCFTGEEPADCFGGETGRLALELVEDAAGGGVS